MRTGGARGAVPGRVLVRASWGATIVFGVTSTSARAGVEPIEDVAVPVALACFGAGLVVWAYAFGKALVRSTREQVTLSGLFLLAPVAPRRIRVLMLGALGASIGFAAFTAPAEPFGVLEPVLPLALAGAWSARHGAFAPREGGGAMSTGGG